MGYISRRHLGLTLAMTFVVHVVRAQEARSPVDGKRLALRGYDPISYFATGHPAKDVVYVFQSAEHRARFSADPERYAPQFAGFCAMTVSNGEKIEADPEAWVIRDGKLFVFRSKAGVAAFEKNPDAVGRAHTNWPTIK